jgi:hypothetical protein
MWVLLEQTLENKTTAYLGWNSFGDVVLKKTAVTSSSPFFGRGYVRGKTEQAKNH